MSMAKIFSNGFELEAAEGPFTLKVWPPESLEATVQAYLLRTHQQSAWINLAGEIPTQVKAHHSRGRPKGGGETQFRENVNQKGNLGKR